MSQVSTGHRGPKTEGILAVRSRECALGRSEWERRFKNRIAARLANPAEFLDPRNVFSQSEAQREAEFELAQAGFRYLSSGFEADPEGSADAQLAGQS